MSSERWNLKNKLALVTGGTKGIGKGIAEELVTHGATVICTSRNKAGTNHARDNTVYIQSDASVSADRSQLVEYIKSLESE